MLNVLIVVVAVVAAGVLLYPPVARSRLWRAAITPLASIIGSGFLVLGPILDASFGAFAPLVMAVLCLGAYLFGGAVRFNIRRLAAAAPARSPTEERLENAASWALAFAYIISVAYYLNLLGAFAVSMTASNDAFHAKLVTTAIFTVILMVGWTHGFSALERLEQISVGVKLSIIAGMLFGLGWYFSGRAADGALLLNPAKVTGWPAVMLVAGLLVTVQGFETSRYLGGEYDAPTRVRSMRLAQGVSTVIYMVYILLLSYSLTPGTMKLTETAIIGLMAVVAPILPLLLISAAISAQFSAAVADTAGSGGLLQELTRRRISMRGGYVAIAAAGVSLTWVATVFEIISYASRALRHSGAHCCLRGMAAARPGEVRGLRAAICPWSCDCGFRYGRGIGRPGAEPAPAQPAPRSLRPRFAG